MCGSVIHSRHMVARHIYRDGLLRDRQRSRIRRRNDILICRVSLVQRITRFSFFLFKIDRIFANILSRSARFGDIVKGNVFLRAGVARFNRLLLSIIRHRGVVRRQRHVLIIVEVKNVIFFIRRNGEGFSRCTLEGVVSIRRNLRRDCIAFICRTRINLERLFITNPVVVHRVVQTFCLFKPCLKFRVCIQPIFLI